MAKRGLDKRSALIGGAIGAVGLAAIIITAGLGSRGVRAAETTGASAQASPSSGAPTSATRPLSGIGASPQVGPPQVVPTAVAHAGPVAVALTRSPLYARTLLSPGTTKHTATVSNGTLTLDGAMVASHVGVVFWANDGTVLFYDTAPPLTDPTAQEPIYAVTPGAPRR